MELTQLGRGGPQVSRVGLGLMGMSGIYGPADEAESIATVRAALDAGITLLDTGDFYGMGHNELLLRDALRGVDRSSVFLQVKFGGQRDPSGAFIGHDASPVAVKNSGKNAIAEVGTAEVMYDPVVCTGRIQLESRPTPACNRAAHTAAPLGRAVQRAVCIDDARDRKVAFLAVLRVAVEDPISGARRLDLEDRAASGTAISARGLPTVLRCAVQCAADVEQRRLGITAVAAAVETVENFLV